MPLKIPSLPMIGMVGPVGQPPKGLYHRIAYVLLNVALLGRENDFAATFALLSRRVARIFAPIT
jgi:hypothetical protein